MKLCACITERTPEDCIDVIKTIETELIEHRLDFMNKIKNLEGIYNITEIPIIATNRPLAFGGHFKGTEEKRVDYLLRAIDAGCEIVDIELETKEELRKKVIDKARENKCKVIVSTHNFTKTPSMQDMLKLMFKEKELGADIGKIVTMANSVEDCHRVLSLLLKAKKIKFPLVAFCMGSIGRFTRVVAPIYGAPFTYVSVKEAAGPGQFDIKQMKKIRELML